MRVACSQLAKLGANLPVEATHAAFGGRADLALRAYQLIQATHLISAQQYISDGDEQDSADLLWAQVSGTSLDDVRDLVARYYERELELMRDFQQFGLDVDRFCLDIGRYITGNNPWAGALVPGIMIKTAQLTEHTAMIVAGGFGDEQTVQDFRTQASRKSRK